jgi:hypothetical protein
MPVNDLDGLYIIILPNIYHIDTAAVWVHVNTHAQHLNIVANIEGNLRHLRQYRVQYQVRHRVEYHT